MVDRPDLYGLESYLVSLSSKISDLCCRIERLERVVRDVRFRSMNGVVDVGCGVDVCGDDDFNG